MNAYERYQLIWMIEHGYSIQSLIRELTRLQYSDPEDSDQISRTVTDLFDEWESEIGFGSEIWICEQEWTENEGASLPVVTDTQKAVQKLL